MTNDEYTDKRQALSQILDILNVIAAKKENGEIITARQHTESDQNAGGKTTRIRYHRESPQGGRVLSVLARLLTEKAMKAFEERRYDEAKKHLHDVLDVISKLPDHIDHREAKACMLNTLAVSECRQGLYDEAVKHLREAIDICEQLPDEIKYVYAKETFEDNLEEVEHKMKQEKEAAEGNATESDDSLLESLQSKSGGYKKYSKKEIEANFHFTNEKPKDVDDVKIRLVILLIIIVAIIILLKFC